MSDYSPMAGVLNGALIERGRVVSVDSQTGAYTIESIDRSEVVTLALQKMGASVKAEVLKGIKTAASRDQTSINALFGVTNDDDFKKLSAEDQALYNALSDSFEQYYSDLSGEAYAVGENIRTMLTEALRDGDLTPEEEEAIKTQIENYNRIIAEIADAEHAIEMQAAMNAAQRVSRESYESWMDELETKRADEIEYLNQKWDYE